MARKKDKLGDTEVLQQTVREVADLLGQHGLDGVCIVSTRATARQDPLVHSASFMLAEDDSRALAMLDTLAEFVAERTSGMASSTQIFGGRVDDQN